MLYTCNRYFLETPQRALEPDLQGSIQKQLPFAKKIPLTQDGIASNIIHVDSLAILCIIL